MRKIFFTFMTVLLATLAAQAATNYNINVGGVEVNSDNASYITGGYITSGYAVYNNNSKTLTLYNLKMEATDVDKFGIHNRGCDNLTIELSGYCRIWVRDNALKLERSTTINALSGSRTQFVTWDTKICANLKSYN